MRQATQGSGRAEVTADERALLLAVSARYLDAIAGASLAPEDRELLLKLAGDGRAYKLGETWMPLIRSIARTQP